MSRRLPRITVVTPSFNQERYLEATVRSVVSQDYPDLEYFVMDGGSTDGSTDILRSYDSRISFWTSGRDGGQSDAINQGFRRATGDILCWINSDDVLEPGALHALAANWTPGTHWLVGRCAIIDSQGNVDGEFTPESPTSVREWIERFLSGGTFVVPQPSTAWTRDAWQKAGPLDRSLHYSFDHAFFLRIFAMFGPPAIVDQRLARFRVHADSKTSSEGARFKTEAVLAARASLSLLGKGSHAGLRLKALHQEGLFRLQEARSARRRSRRDGVRGLATATRCAPHLLVHPDYWRTVRHVLG